MGYLDFFRQYGCLHCHPHGGQARRQGHGAGGGRHRGDSVPEREYAESGNKARAVMEAMALASEVND